jgi:ammonium transporter Rh
VFNLHGMPGIFGGLASALFSTLFYHANSKLIVHGVAKQPLYQLLGLAITLVAATLGGLVAGFIVKNVHMAKQTLAEEELFEDSVFWAEVEHEEK